MPNNKNVVILGNRALSTIITKNKQDQIKQLKDFLKVFY